MSLHESSATHENSTEVWSDFCMKIYTDWMSHNALRTSCACWCSTCLHGLTPRYLAELCVLVADVMLRCKLRSATRGILDFPRHNVKNYGWRAFSYAAPLCLELTARTSATIYFNCHFEVLTQDLFIRADVAFSALERCFCSMGYISLFNYLLTYLNSWTWGVPAVSPSKKKLFPISMKFGMYIEVDDWCTTVCHMTRFKVKVKVTGLLKFRKLHFSNSISSAIYNGRWKVTTNS